MTGQLPGDSYWASEGEVLAGPYPGAATSEEAQEKLAALLDFGITFFVDLTEENEGPPLAPYAPMLWEVAADTHRAAHYARLPIRDLGVPLEWQMRATLATIDQAVQAGEVVYVHCWGGVGRTGTVGGCLLVECGCPRENVLARIADLRAHTQRAWRESPETKQQREFVLAWRAVLPADAPPAG